MSSTSYFAHESSYIDDGAEIGEGTRIWHFCHVMPGARIGGGCSIGQNVVVMNGTRIGNNVRIQNNVSIYEGVELEDDVFCGPSMVFTNVVNPRSHVSRKHEYRDTLVRRGATLGANCTIVCGHTIGRYAFVGAGAVNGGHVTDVEERELGGVRQRFELLGVQDELGAQDDSSPRPHIIRHGLAPCDM